MDNVYTGEYDDVEWYNVFLNGKPFDLKPSQKIRNHSPDGFAWGYNGSGPAQLALAILLNETKDAELSQTLYQEFKEQVIAHYHLKDGFKLTSSEVHDWLEKKLG